MEKLIYESRPYFFILAGIAAIYAQPSGLAVASALLLIGSSLHIVRCRLKYRAAYAVPEFKTTP